MGKRLASTAAIKWLSHQFENSTGTSVIPGCYREDDENLRSSGLLRSELW